MDEEFMQIIEKIISNRKFKRLKNEKHHTTNRFNHSLEVAYKTYKVCKRLNLDYISATKAALLHDYFFDEEFKNKTKKKKLVTHYKRSIINAKKITTLTTKEEKIIASHMFPVGGHIPTSLEAIVVDIVDDTVSIKETAHVQRARIRNALSLVTILFISFLSK